VRYRRWKLHAKIVKTGTSGINCCQLQAVVLVKMLLLLGCVLRYALEPQHPQCQ
jgi:tetrahydromethanopterin S-methyltransferase subunit F